MRYALVVGEHVESVVVWDGSTEWQAPQDATPVAVPDGMPCGPGWSYRDGEFIAPDPEPVVWTWDLVRIERDRLLAASDWTQVADAPVDSAAWAVYRQALRDVPQDFDSPDDVVWPTSPS